MACLSLYLTSVSRLRGEGVCPSAKTTFRALLTPRRFDVFKALHSPSPLACLGLVGLLLTFAFEDRARAQQGSGLTPPQLKTFVEATYPEAARAERLAAQVELELVVGEDGKVREAKVLSASDPRFAEPAREAALRFEFEPARKEGKAIPAAIRYRYVFAPPPEPVVEAPPAPAKGALEARLKDPKGRPLAGAEVILIAPDQSTQRKISDGQGRVVFSPLPAGRYRLRIIAANLQELDAQEEVRPGESTEVVYRLRQGEDREAFGATAVVEPPPREVTRRSIGKEELVRIPGTRGDALRAVELLPGVARPPFGTGLLIVRGSAPGDSEYFVEGSSIPLVYHFGGLTSVINSRLLERIDFYPGNFSARYGRRTGGILDIGIRDPAQDRFHGVVDLNVIDSSILVETPIGKKGGIALAARRSYIDLFFDKVVPDDAFSVLAAPVYWDYQLIGTYRPTSRDRLKVITYGSGDRLRLLLSDAADSDPNIRGGLGLETTFHRVDTSWRRQINENVDQDLSFSIGPTRLGFNAGPDLRLDLDFLQIYGRGEWRARLSRRVRIIGGFDIFNAPFRVTFRGPAGQQQEGAGVPEQLSSQEVREDRNVGISYRPGAYVESDVLLTQKLRALIGTRFDWFSEIDRGVVDPRLTLIYSLTDKTRLKSGVGSYSQPPEFQESGDDSSGNPNLRPIRSLHTSLGFDHTLREGMTVGVDGFYKHLFDRVVSTPNGERPTFINNGVGRIYGLELSGRVQPIRRRFFGFLSYTLMRSERRDRDDPWRLFDFDQTHIFTLSGVYRLGRGWEIGGTFRLVSGNPYTPVVGSVYDANSDIYIPISGAINSLRNPPFHRLDLRVEKQWRFPTWMLALYLDVQNVYNRRNREATSYSYDYTRSMAVPGLPIIPSLGLRGEI